MMSAVTNTLIRILGISLTLCVIDAAQCPVDTVIIKGMLSRTRTRIPRFVCSLFTRRISRVNLAK